MPRQSSESFRKAPGPQGLHSIYMQDLILFFLVLWQQRFQCLQSYQVLTGRAGDFASLAHAYMEPGTWESAQAPLSEQLTSELERGGRRRGALISSQSRSPLGIRPQDPAV